jgi:hypothetical protein
MEKQSEQITEIVGEVPKWPVRWGMTLILFIVIFLITISYWVKYPSLITGEIIITSTPAPVNFISSLDCSIDSIFVTNNQLIESNQPILAVTNNALETEKNLVLKSTTKGKILFTDIWRKNQIIKTGDPIYSIVPVNNLMVFGKVVIDDSNFGRISIGQKVLIDINGYPSEEFGYVQGEIKSITPIIYNHKYLVEVVFDKNTLLTTFKKTIDYNNELSGQARIVLDERTLLSRIFNTTW